MTSRFVWYGKGAHGLGPPRTTCISRFDLSMGFHGFYDEVLVFELHSFCDRLEAEIERPGTGQEFSVVSVVNPWSYNQDMLTAYIQAAMRRAHYEMIDDPRPFYGSIPECQGVWARGETLEACRDELQDVLEDWLALGLRLGHPIPGIDGIRLESGKPVPVDA